MHKQACMHACIHSRTSFSPRPTALGGTATDFVIALDTHICTCVLQKDTYTHTHIHTLTTVEDAPLGGIAAGLLTALAMYVIVRVVAFHWSGVLSHWYVLFTHCKHVILRTYEVIYL